jgi:hypothetical protein
MKLTLIGICAFALLFNTGCATNKTKAPEKAATSKNVVASAHEQLPPVAEAPAATPWGRNISPFGY